MRKSKKVLITGVAGFIGSNLAERLLALGHKVIGIDNLSAGLRGQVPRGVDFHKLDIRSKKMFPLCRGVDCIFHLAAQSSIPACDADPLTAESNNVMGTVNVFEAARRAKSGKVVYAQTSAIYEASNVYPTPETEIAPSGFYAISKLCTHYFGKGYEKAYGLKTVGLRYFNVYGPRQDFRRSVPPVMIAFIMKLLRGEQPIIYGTGKQRRDFIHVDDINDFHILAMNDRRADNKVFNLGSGTNNSVLEIYGIIAKIIGIKKPPIFKPVLGSPAKQNLADITEAKKLGWRPRVNMENGLRQMIEYVKREYKGLICKT